MHTTHMCNTLHFPFPSQMLLSNLKHVLVHLPLWTTDDLWHYPRCSRISGGWTIGEKSKVFHFFDVGQDCLLIAHCFILSLRKGTRCIWGSAACLEKCGSTDVLTFPMGPYGSRVCAYNVPHFGCIFCVCMCESTQQPVILWSFNLLLSSEDADFSMVNSYQIFPTCPYHMDTSWPSHKTFSEIHSQTL